VLLIFFSVTMENLLRYLLFSIFKQALWVVVFTLSQYTIVKSAELGLLSLNCSTNIVAVNMGRLRLYTNLTVHFVARILVKNKNCVNICVHIQERNHSPVNFVRSTLHRMKTFRWVEEWVHFILVYDIWATNIHFVCVCVSVWERERDMLSWWLNSSLPRLSATSGGWNLTCQDVLSSALL
jgi:hypothetical protein